MLVGSGERRGRGIGQPGDGRCFRCGSGHYYRRRMKDLQARSRLVPTDSLARLYAALVPTAEPARHALRQAIMCQYAILLATYGQAATSRSERRADRGREYHGFGSPATNYAAVTPSASAWKLSTTRCASTGSAMAATSSRSGIPRPPIAARAVAPGMRYCDARGPAPQLTYFFTSGLASCASGRVARASFTA